MSYFREQDTGDELENWAKWAGDAPQILQSIKFDDQRIEWRDKRLSDSVTRVGCDAQRAYITETRLHALDEKEGRALRLHHLERWLEKQKARECGCQVNAFRNRVRDAHIKFWGGSINLSDPQTRASVSVCENVE